ncbi:gas vesicle protein [Pseudonocardia sp. NPDC049635]|uniref:gas vesicle protein GvpO n=1 Tax=Pseudonocardia sp. NPDC049635 TaxID=3155506 RepID=UPI0033D37F50
MEADEAATGGIGPADVARDGKPDRAELDDPELDDPELDDPELDDPELDDPELDDPELDDPGLDDPGPDEPDGRDLAYDSTDGVETPTDRDEVTTPDSGVGESGPAGDAPGPDGAEADPAPRRRIGARAAARAAVEQVHEMTGKTPEGVTFVSREDGGWRIGVEVVETERIPDSADVLAVYEAELDPEAELMSYQRVRRYQRGRGDD